jgi:DNA-directed RNA polymerase subunit beta
MLKGFRIMTASFTTRKRIRKSFGRIPEVIAMPNLIEVQRNSYELFLQMHTPAAKRQRIGLQEVFHSVFPMEDYTGKARLDFASCGVGY